MNPPSGISAPIRRIAWRAIVKERPELSHSLEWLATNGLGGYASGTISGIMTRRYHGLLISAMPVPLGRIVMLTSLFEQIRLPDGTKHHLMSEEDLTKRNPFFISPYLSEFRLQWGLPVWRYEIDGFVFEKQILFPHRQNTVHVTYRMIRGDGSVRLQLRPAVNFRRHESPVDSMLLKPYALKAIDNRFELETSSEFPPLRMFLYGELPAFIIDGHDIRQVYYESENNRGYASSGDLWSPGTFRAVMDEDNPVTVVASTERWETILALRPKDAILAEERRRARLLADAPQAAREHIGDDLILAADQFITTPTGRVEDSARARAAGDEVCSVIAGYHWFTDWGRDTMISLEGLTLITGRHLEAGYILRTFGRYIQNGLIPNMFPEGNNEGLYNTADATLWFFHAIDRYLHVTGDRITLQHLLPLLVDIIECHRRGTVFGIGMDPDDNLLIQGESGYALTWMDAKVGDWVVTPRRGKAVEINALWYNALCLLQEWTENDPENGKSADYAKLAARVRESFNLRFWHSAGEFLYDIVDGESGDDPACRPNQIFAISLRYPVLASDKWSAVIKTVKRELLTPVGLRSLGQDHPDYKRKYFGDLQARDAAYHQGTVWGWLIGPFIDAWLKLYPDRIKEARGFLSGFVSHMDEAGVGTISEVFDAESPFIPRGCIAQAWSVAEVLRSLAKTGS